MVNRGADVCLPGVCVPMKLRWMFRATELVTQAKFRGTLAIYSTDHDEWRAVFNSDTPGIGPLEIARPLLRFAGDKGIVELPSPDDPECRDLGEARFIVMNEISVIPKPVRASFEVRGRLPVTSEKTSTAVASVSVPVGVRGG